MDRYKFKEKQETNVISKYLPQDTHFQRTVTLQWRKQQGPP